SSASKTAKPVTINTHATLRPPRPGGLFRFPFRGLYPFAAVALVGTRPASGSVRSPWANFNLQEDHHETYRFGRLDGHPQRREGYDLRAERGAQGHAVFVRVAVRRRPCDQPGGTDRRRPRRLLRDGALELPRNRGLPPRAPGREGRRHVRAGRRELD